MNIYQEKILDHYNNPRNYGKLAKPDYSAKLENTACGDRIEVYIKTKANKISSLKFTADGCAISIASASILSEELIGKPLHYIKQIDAEKMMSLLGIELTISRIKCATLALEAFKNALIK